MPSFVLYSYWRSSCAWRVRSALKYKGFDYEYRAVSLLPSQKGDVNQEMKELAPFEQVPCLVVQGIKGHAGEGKEIVLTQSIAICQFLDDMFPDTPALLPKCPVARAQVRMVTDSIAAGIQPLQNVTVLWELEAIEKGKGQAFCKDFITKRFYQLEQMLLKTAGTHCVGNSVTLADLCLVPQVYNAVRFEVDMTPFTKINEIYAMLLKTVPAIVQSHPDEMPDAVKVVA